MFWPLHSSRFSRCMFPTQMLGAQRETKHVIGFSYMAWNGTRVLYVCTYAIYLELKNGGGKFPEILIPIWGSKDRSFGQAFFDRFKSRDPGIGALDKHSLIDSNLEIQGVELWASIPWSFLTIGNGSVWTEPNCETTS